MTKRNIQNEILARILRNESVRYSEAHPPRVENDLFNYHLQFLVQKGLVQKTNNLYSLTNKGKYYVNYSNPLNPLGESIDKFKVNVLTIVLKVEGGNVMVLNQIRKRHPFYNHQGIMGGPIKQGESAENAAKRKLKSETGLDANFKVLGVVRNTSVNKEGEIFSDIFFVPCLTLNSSGTLKKQTAFGENFWVGIDEAMENENQPTAPTKKLVEILKTLKTNPQATFPAFFSEETRHIDSY